VPPPELFLLGGPNGAGKTTGAAVLLPERLAIDQFVNADAIAADHPGSPVLSARAAGRIVLRRIHELRERRESFAFESTLAARTLGPFVRGARADGYHIHIAFLWLSRVEIACHRIRLRVREGGHHVPDEVVARRYSRGLVNLFNLFLPLATTWVICDNSGSEIRIVARGRVGSRPTIISPATYERILGQVSDAGRTS
jgi:predicted ABC-type ATPase